MARSTRASKKATGGNKGKQPANAGGGGSSSRGRGGRRVHESDEDNSGGSEDERRYGEEKADSEPELDEGAPTMEDSEVAASPYLNGGAQLPASVLARDLAEGAALGQNQVEYAEHKADGTIVTFRLAECTDLGRLADGAFNAAVAIHLNQAAGEDDGTKPDRAAWLTKLGTDMAAHLTAEGEETTLTARNVHDGRFIIGYVTEDMGNGDHTKLNYAVFSQPHPAETAAKEEEARVAAEAKAAELEAKKQREMRAAKAKEQQAMLEASKKAAAEKAAAEAAKAAGGKAADGKAAGAGTASGSAASGGAAGGGAADGNGAGASVDVSGPSTTQVRIARMKRERESKSTASGDAQPTLAGSKAKMTAAYQHAMRGKRGIAVIDVDADHTPSHKARREEPSETDPRFHVEARRAMHSQKTSALFGRELQILRYVEAELRAVKTMLDFTPAERNSDSRRCLHVHPPKFGSALARLFVLEDAVHAARLRREHEAARVR